MSELGFLRLQILLGAVGWWNLDRHTLDNMDAAGFERIKFPRIVRHEPHARNFQLTKNGGA